MIKVIIDRTVADGLEQHYENCLRETAPLLEDAMGFLGSETLKDVHNNSRRITVSLWDNIQCWKRWLQSKNRQLLHSRITPLLDHEEKITVLKH